MTTQPRTILLATANPAKLQRLMWLLDGLPLNVRVPAELGIQPPPVAEWGRDFVENAVEKALAWSVLVPGVSVLTSDGGLRVPALGRRWDGLFTRRNSGLEAGNLRRIEHLLSLMDGLSGDERACEWCEALALARDGVSLTNWTASGSGGVIVEHYVPAESDDQFWTESIRLQPSLGKLYRDMSDEELAYHDTVWPSLHGHVRAYFSRS